ncbi:MAG: hypothetical protein ACFFDD_15660, partial [Promethearchaeota archaeon]
MIQEWIEIKICPKCGKANNVTRKFCAGCGASLLRKVEEDEPAAVEEVEKTPFAPTPSIPEEEKYVRPSEVASEQAKMEVGKPQPYGVTEEPSLPREEVKAPPPREMEMEKGREVVQDILEKVRAAEARSRGEEVAPEPEMEVEAPPEEIMEEVEESIPYEEPIVEAEVEEDYEEEEYEEEEEEEEEEYEEEVVEEEVVEELEP